MLKIKVKASSITNLTDARYFAAREVEWLGFPLGSGGDSIDPLTAKAMVEWVDGVKIVGEFDLSTAEEVRQVSGTIGTDTVQIGMFTALVDVRQLDGLKVIKEVVIDPNISESELTDHLEAYAPHCEHFLLNFSKSGITWSDLQSSSPLSLTFLKNICEKYSAILDLDCPTNEVDSLLEKVRPTALSFHGGEEEKVGYKSFDELDELLDQLEIPE